MLSAKDYYYLKIAPEEANKNYQQAHQNHLYTDRSDQEQYRIITHVPNLSNDILIEDYMGELITNVNAEIAERLKNSFIAKRKNFFANAGAVHSKKNYDGDLVFFYVGLSDVLFQYAILFTEFVELTALRKTLGDNDPKTISLLYKLCSDIEKLTEAQIEWGINRNEIRFKDEVTLMPSDNIVEKATAIAILMDKSILRHELAHHLLGHTGISDSISLDIIEQFLEGQEYSHEHKKEIEADLFGLYLPISGTSNSTEQFNQSSIDVTLGTLLAQTTLAQLKADIYQDS